MNIKNNCKSVKVVSVSKENTKRTPYWFHNLHKVKITSRKLIFEMEEKAGQWQTCACGEQDKNIPRWEGEPIDQNLRKLGIRFACALTDMYLCYNSLQFEKYRDKALDILNKIEDRAGIVLAQALKTKKKK